MSGRWLKSWPCIWLAGLWLAAGTGWGQAIVTVTGFGPTQWGTTDTVLGITGYTLENFEDTTLAAGVRIGWDSPAGIVTPAATIPFIFNPVTDDPFGTAFSSPASGVWDGASGLINTRTNQSYTYTATANWGDVLLSFTAPVYSVGFSIEQMDMEARLIVNGVDVGGLAALAGFTPNGARQGYVRIDATAGNSITSIRLNNGRAAFNDGFMIDHLAFQAIPEPPTAALLLLGAGLFWFRRRRG